MDSTATATVEKVIVETLRTMASAPAALTMDATLSELDIDSLDLVELTQILEERYGVELPSRGLDEAVTIRDIVDCLAARLVTAGTA